MFVVVVVAVAVAAVVVVAIAVVVARVAPGLACSGKGICSKPC